LGLLSPVPIRKHYKAKSLGRFAIEVDGENYLLQIDDEDGATVELTAALEQLDLIGGAIDELLAQDDAD